MAKFVKPAPTGPDKLLVEIGKSIMTKAIVISIIAHFVLTVLTSFSLFADWTVWGFHAPATINQMKAQKAREDEEAKRKAEAEEKARKAAAEATAAAKTNQTAKASAPAKPGAKPAAKAPSAKSGDDKAPAAAPAADGKKTPPEVQPLPRKDSFELGDDLSLD